MSTATATPDQGEGRRTISVAQAARELGIGRSLAYELARTTGCLGGVPVVRLGRRIVVPRSALDRVLAGEITPPDRGAIGGAA
jgi:Helix-turn-helix domain